MFQIMVVDDDRNTRRLLQAVLEADGYKVLTAENGEDALALMDSEYVDLVVLDIMMPKMDGYEFTRTLRETNNNLPVLMVSAKELPSDKKHGFLVGTDDYMTKPFSMKELMARVKANIRRRSMEYSPAQSTAGQIEADGLCLNPETYQVTKNGTPVELTQKEYDLLSYLIRERGKVFSREDLMQRVWNYDYYGDMRTVDVTVRRLREKIEPSPSDPKFVHTKWGVGYYFQAK